MLLAQEQERNDCQQQEMDELQEAMNRQSGPNTENLVHLNSKNEFIETVMLKLMDMF